MMMSQRSICIPYVCVCVCVTTPRISSLFTHVFHNDGRTRFHVVPLRAVCACVYEKKKSNNKMEKKKNGTSVK